MRLLGWLQLNGASRSWASFEHCLGRELLLGKRDLQEHHHFSKIRQGIHHHRIILEGQEGAWLEGSHSLEKYYIKERGLGAHQREHLLLRIREFGDLGFTSKLHRIPCKYFARGTCFKGEHCNFSHDWRDQPNKVCTFYQKGLCTYGNRCRYNHVIVSDQVTTDATSKSYSYRESSSSRIASPSRAFFSGETSQSFIVPEVISAPNHVHASYFRGDTSPSKGNNHAPALADMQICSLNIASSCPHGERCSRIHGEQCYVCGKYCLHPFRAKEREEHIRTCQKNSKLLETIKYSQEIECSICQERVFAKPTDAVRKFGILPECDHPFCIECIRIWRKNSAASGIDLNTAVRACPVCRKHSHFVVPSFIWFSTQEEKQEIIDNYKEKLKSIDCKYFDFGNGICPFKSSCFYKHTKLYERPGTGFRPLRHRPRIHRLTQLAEDDDEDEDEDEELDGIVDRHDLDDDVDEDEEEELDGIVDRHDLEQYFANFSSLFDTDEEEPESVDDSDFCNFLALSLLLMYLCAIYFLV